MKTMLCAGLAMALSVHGHGQVPSNVLLRVRMLNAAGEVGSSFTVDVDGRQYLITAKHVVKKLKNEDAVRFLKDDKTWSVPVSVKVFRCDDPIDIAVLAPGSQLTVNYPLEPTSDKLLLGQDAYFVGFPYGVYIGAKLEQGLYPVPFVKKGTFSAMTSEAGAGLLFLDGHNNPGFSGGPIVYRDMNQGNFVFYVASVVSGFRAEYIHVMDPQPLKAGDEVGVDPNLILKLPTGEQVKVVEMKQLVPANTGIVVGYNIKHAVELIRRNPVGPKLAQ